MPGLTRLGLVGGGTNSEESATVASVATQEVSATTGSDATAASDVSAVRPSVSASGTSCDLACNFRASNSRRFVASTSQSFCSEGDDG